MTKAIITVLLLLPGLAFSSSCHEIRDEQIQAECLEEREHVYERYAVDIDGDTGPYQESLDAVDRRAAEFIGEEVGD